MSALILVGCGGGGDTSGLPSGPFKQFGTLVDSTVYGVSYQTETLSGITDNGRFEYMPGETVTFSIGDITFPPVLAEKIITPFTLAGTTDLSDPTVINILRLLQSLDSDEFLNSISIASSSIDAAKGVSLDFTLPVADFETAAADYLMAAVGDPNLVAQADAIAHFERTIAALSPVGGVWVKLTNGTSYLVFLDKTRYIIAHIENNEPDNITGSVLPVSAEYGTYTWDSSSGDFNAVVSEESDGEGGLSGNISNLFIGSDGWMTMSDPCVCFFVSDQLSRVDRWSDHILVGAWLLPEGSGYNVLMFLDHNSYLIVHTNNQEFDDVVGAVVPVSAEYGTYTWDSTTGDFSVVVSGQSDGEGGLSHPRGNVTLAIDGDVLTLTDSVDGPVTLTKISP